MKVLEATSYVAAVGCGVVVASLAPHSWLLPVFFVCLGVTVLLAALAHTTPEAKEGLTTGQVLFALLTPLVGPPGSVVRAGYAPHLFTLALVFTCGFVLVLAVARSAA